jgi:tetratricopeptide (TPR) repeat protein
MSDSRSVVNCDRVLSGRFSARKAAVAGWLLAASLLLGFTADGRCLGGPPATASVAETNAFGAIAQDIEKSVLRLGYPKTTADELVSLVRGWGLETWKQKLAQARSASPTRNAAEIARVEEDATKVLYAKIGKEISTCDEPRYFYLSAVLKDRKAQCLGYSQLFYVLGNSVGLSVSAANILEPPAGTFVAGASHVACIVGRSDSTCIFVDLALQVVSRPFVFHNEYVLAGNYWELKREENQLRIHRRIQACNEAGLVACIYNNLGNRYDDTGQHSQAISCHTKAIELNPKYADPYNNRANVYDKIRQPTQAISDYNKAIELDPKFAGAYYNRANMYDDLRQYSKAISDYNKAIELNPQYAEALYNRAKVYGKLGQPAQAISDCSMAIKLNPKYTEAFCNRGNRYVELGQYPQAISDYTKAIELNPKYATAFYNRGNVYLRLGQHANAFSDFNKTIELDIKYAVAYAGRGTVYAYQGKKDEARADFKKALELNPALREPIRKTSDQFQLGL